MHETWEEKIRVLMGLLEDAISEGLDEDPSIPADLHSGYRQRLANIQRALVEFLDPLCNGDSMWK